MYDSNTFNILIPLDRDWETDIGYGMEGNIVGTNSLSLGDLVSEPQLALNRMRVNFERNAMEMVIQTTLTRFGFKFGKKLLSAPIANINRNLMKPVLGAGIKI